MYLKTTVALLFFLAYLCLQAAEPVNTVIGNMTDQYIFVPDKSGLKLECIKQHKSITFLATKTATTAHASISYDNFRTVDNAKAKGSKPIYGNATSAGIFFDDSRMCILPIKLDKVGKSITATFDCTLKSPERGHLVFVGANYPVKQYTLSLTMPISMKDIYDIEATNLPENASITRAPSPDGKNWIITLAASNLPALNLPSDAPSPRRTLPLVCFTGMFKDVNDFYTRIRQYILRQDPGLENVAEKARQITSQCKSDAERIAAIHHWVNTNIRYIAIEYGELGWEPELASVVLQKRYGDCKGSANLIKAMLNAVNIDGRMVWIGTRSIPDDWTARPLFSTGNHMIAAAILPGDSILYLDGTVGATDCGYYTGSVQGKQTLIENEDKCIIHRVPILPPASNCDDVTVNYAIDGTTLHGKFIETVSGEFKARLLNSLNNTDRRYRNKQVLGFINEGRNTWAFDNVTLHNDTVNNGPTKITAEVTRSAGIQKVGDNSYLSLDIIPSILGMIFELEDRTAPGEISVSKRLSRTISVKLPEGTTLRELPVTVHISNPTLTASLEYTSDQDTVTARLLMDFTQGIIPLKELENFNNDIRTLSRAINNKLVLVNQ